MPKPRPPKRPSPPSGARRRAWYGLNPSRRKKDGKEPDEGGVPVVPDRPLTLSGGAAAELEFDD